MLFYVTVSPIVLKCGRLLVTVIYVMENVVSNLMHSEILLDTLIKWVRSHRIDDILISKEEYHPSHSVLKSHPPCCCFFTRFNSVEIWFYFCLLASTVGMYIVFLSMKLWHSKLYLLHILNEFYYVLIRCDPVYQIFKLLLAGRWGHDEFQRNKTRWKYVKNTI